MTVYNYTYLIYKSGSTYYAKNGLTGTTEFSNSNFTTLLQTACNAISTGSAKGGKIFIKNGTYPCSVEVNIANVASTGNPNVIIEGESRDATILQATANVNILAPFCNTTIRNLTIDGNNIGQRCVASGQSVIVEIYNCRIKRHTNIGVWFGYDLKGFIVKDNIFELPASENDQMAFTCKEFGIVENNYFDRTGGMLHGSCLTVGFGNNVIIRGNVVRKSSANIVTNMIHGISLEPFGDYDKVLIDGNIIENGTLRVGGLGAFTYKFYYFTIANNIVKNSDIWIIGPTEGPFDTQMRYFLISNNQVIGTESTSTGIHVDRVAGPTIMNNNMLQP